MSQRGVADEAALPVQNQQPTLVDKEGVLVAEGQPISDIADVVPSERDERLRDLLGRDQLAHPALDEVPDVIDQLLEHPISIPQFTPLQRDELYRRD